ncbi:MAG TPA: hypothetical protein VFT66_13805 [Roseiflexaceae bacterium]|nr:hypothetical protein [Roseiflexaceae bacterium]
MHRTIRELFVDRDRQLAAFRAMLGGQSSRRIMIVRAEEGMGKTWLLQTFASEAEARGLPHVYVDFGDGQSYDSLSLVRHFRDALGVEQFPHLNEAIAAVLAPQLKIATDGAKTPSVNINVEGSTLANSPVTVQDVGTIVKNNTFVFQTDSPIIRQAIEDRVTTAVFDDLAALSQHTTPVFLFDTYERTSTQIDGWVPNEADRWICGQLLARIRDQRLQNVVVVIAGERTPEFGAEWNGVLGRMALHPLECSDVDVYLRQRRGLASISDAEIQVLCQAVNGSPQVLGLVGDNLELSKNPAARDDEW